MRGLSPLMLRRPAWQALGNTLYALARLRHNPGRATLEAILQPASARELSDFSDMSLSMVLWSCAQLHFDGQREVLAAMLQELARREAPEPSVVSQSMWAAAVLELLTPEVGGQAREGEGRGEPVHTVSALRGRCI